MRLVVVGGSQGTGAAAVRIALDRGHDVTVFARTPQRLALEHPRLRRVAGDLGDPTAVGGAVEGADAVLLTAMPSTLKAYRADPDFLARGTATVLDAMRTHGARRIVILSALGVGDSRPLLPWFVRWLVTDVLLKVPYADHAHQERIVRDSGLEWVIARPSRLGDGPPTGKTVKTAKLEPVPSLVSRADVAAFLVEAATTDTWLRQAVHLGG